MRTRVWCMSLVLAGLGVACGDQPTEVAPEGVMTRAPGFIAYATASSDDGLSISTDKDDYQPGDTVLLTGAGWPGDDTLDIVLEDEPATHDPHRWTVNVDPDGTFHDATYVVDVGDIGVTFTLTATSRTTGRWLTVMFTDGNIGSVGFSFFPAGASSGTAATGCTGTSGTSVVAGTQMCAQASFTITAPPNNATAVSIRWRNPAGSVVAVSPRSPDFPSTITGTQAFAASFTPPASPSSVGTWTVLLCESNSTSMSGPGATGCTAGPQRGSATFTVTEAAVATTTSIISSQNPSASGQEVTFTASVTSGSPAAAVTTGSVTFRSGTCSGAILSGPTDLNNSGQASFSKSDLAIGSHTIFACYGGASGFQESSASLEQEVKSTATEIELTSSVNPSVTGQSVTFTAKVSNNSNPVTAGQVAFKKGGNDCSDATQVQGPQNLSGTGQVTYTAAFDASDSPITIRACYTGSAPTLDPSESAVIQNVDKASTTTTVGASPSPSVFSQSVTFTVTVSAQSPGAGTPTGSVSLKEGSCGGAAIGTATTLSGGQAIINVSTLNAGTHTVAACYQGDDDFEGGSGTVSHTVDLATTTTMLISSANPSVFSQTVTFTATVAAVAPAVATPTGTVDFKNGSCTSGVLLDEVTLNGSGVASLDVSTLTVGPHTISACYRGTTNFKTSENDVQQQVNKAETQTQVTSTPVSSVFSQEVTFDVSVTSKSPAVATPVGNVTLKDGTCAGTTIGGPVALDADGEATFTVSTLAVGTHTITACYAGNASFEGSDGGVSHTVDQASTATAVTSSPNPSVLNEAVSFDVTVTPVSPAVATPAGLVTLKDGSCTSGTQLGTPASLDADGKVSFSISTLSVGPHSVSACYAGNLNFKSSSGSVTQQVKYNFDGLFAPVDRPNTFNVSKAGQAIPLKWRLTDVHGNPVLNLTSVTVKVQDAGCAAGVSTDQMEEYATGASGLQNLGNGNYQFNWKTPGGYASSCKRIFLEFVPGTPGYTEGPLAYFTFKK